MSQTWSSVLGDSLLPEVHPHEGRSVVSIASLGAAGGLVHHHLQLLVALGQGRLHHTRRRRSEQRWVRCTMETLYSAYAE